MGSSKANKEAKRTLDKDNVVSKLAETFGRSVRAHGRMSALLYVSVNISSCRFPLLPPLHEMPGSAIFSAPRAAFSFPCTSPFSPKVCLLTFNSSLVSRIAIFHVVYALYTGSDVIIPTRFANHEFLAIFSSGTVGFDWKDTLSRWSIIFHQFCGSYGTTTGHSSCAPRRQQIGRASPSMETSRQSGHRNCLEDLRTTLGGPKATP